MSPIEAIYRHGVFEPLDRVMLPENQRVRLMIEPASNGGARQWLEEVQRVQNSVLKRQNSLPDTAPDIAADRLR